MPRISVIVPVYNVEPYIHQSVDSILAQTFTDFELILVDDGSPDNCPSICDEYVKKDNRVHVIHQENSGLSAARNAGLEIAKGDYVSFVDSDDMIHPQFLALLVDAIQSKEYKIVACQLTCFDNGLEFEPIDKCPIACMSSEEACERLYDIDTYEGISFITAWGKLYSRDLFDHIRFPVGRLNEDQFVTYKLIYAMEEIGLVKAPLYGYRINPTGIMHSTFTIQRYDNLDALYEAKAFFYDRNERSIVDHVQKRIDWTKAAYSLYARKNGIYRKVNRAYKLPFRKAYQILVNERGVDKADYFVYQLYPNYIRFLSVIRKLKRT